MYMPPYIRSSNMREVRWCHNHLNFIRRSVYDLRRSRSPRRCRFARCVACIYILHMVACFYVLRFSLRLSTHVQFCAPVLFIFCLFWSARGREIAREVIQRWSTTKFKYYCVVELASVYVKKECVCVCVCMVACACVSVRPSLRIVFVKCKFSIRKT